MKTKLISFLIPLSLFALPDDVGARTVNVGFQNVPLEKGEHINRIEIRFTLAGVRAITNIPQDWDFHLNLDRGQPFPRIFGFCLHGAGAVADIEELPTFQVEPFQGATTPVSAEATLWTENFETGEEKTTKTLITEIQP